MVAHKLLCGKKKTMRHNAVDEDLGVIVSGTEYSIADTKRLIISTLVHAFRGVECLEYSKADR